MVSRQVSSAASTSAFPTPSFESSCTMRLRRAIRPDSLSFNSSGRSRFATLVSCLSCDGKLALSSF